MQTNVKNSDELIFLIVFVSESKYTRKKKWLIFLPQLEYYTYTQLHVWWKRGSNILKNTQNHEDILEYDRISLFM